MIEWRGLRVCCLDAATRTIAPASQNGDECSVNAVCNYEIPFSAVSSIKRYLAFYQERVDTFSGLGQANGRKRLERVSSL